MTGLIYVHISLVVVSISLFVWRGLAMCFDRPVKGLLWQRILPDSLDTLLLISGILLAYSMGFLPWQDMWFLAKLLAILTYITLGFAALGHIGGRWFHRGCFLIALLTLFYIVGVAHTMTVWPWGESIF